MKIRYKNIIGFFVIASFLVILASTLVHTTSDGKECYQFRSDTVGIHSNDYSIDVDNTIPMIVEDTMEDTISIFKPPNPMGDEPIPTLNSRPPNPIGDEPIPTFNNKI